MLRPVGAKTFDDYVKSSILQYVSTKAKNYERLHFVFDVYNPNSLKDATRQKRGSGIRIKVTLQAPVPTNWHGFLSESSNKTLLFNLIADYLQQVNPYTTDIFVTKLF